MGTEFRSEQEMMDAVVALLASGASPWAPTHVLTEFDYASGRTDLIARLDSNMVLALEAKLTRWREALHQAYRNTCFAHQSLVVLPWKTAERANAHRHEFERRKVGLCGVKADGLVMMIEPGSVNPVLPHLTNRAMLELGFVAEAHA